MRSRPVESRELARRREAVCQLIRTLSEEFFVVVEEYVDLVHDGGRQEVAPARKPLRMAHARHARSASSRGSR